MVSFVSDGRCVGLVLFPVGGEALTGQVYRVPCPSCGTLMLAESSACRSCAQAFRKKASKERPYSGITELEPLETWRCDRCPYWIYDERSVVADAAKHHEREAH